MDEKTGTPTEYQDGEGPVTKVNLGRLTNCIFAFSLLFLFKNIELPSTMDTESTLFLSGYLKIILPEVFNFMNAFLVIAIIWVLSFHILHLIRRVNHTFLFLHFGMLITLVFIPVTSMFADNFPTITIFSLILHLNILVIGSFLFMEWRYVCVHGSLIHLHISGKGEKETYLRIFFLMGASVIGSILTFYDVEQTRFIYILVILILFIDSVVTDRTRGIEDPDSDDLSGAGISESPAYLSQTGRVVKTSQYRGPVGMDMLEILMNGVFGFTMTLIVKNIILPKASDGQNVELIVGFFIRTFFDTLEFILVFIILAIFWVLAFQLLRWMRAVDLTFVYLELFELLLIVFIPVTSSLLTLFWDQSHVSTIYALNIIFCGFVLIIQWYYVSRRSGLMNEEATLTIRNAPRRSYLGGRIRIRSGEGRVQSFIEIRNRLFILPVTFLVWLVLNLFEVTFAIIPAAMGVCYLLYRSGD